MKQKIALAGILALTLTSNVFAKVDEYIQSIYIVNQLAAKLDDPGMTPTDIAITYFNGSETPCWRAFLTYRKDITIHAGPTQGCKNKVNRIEIKPLIMIDKLKNYETTPINIDIDQTKFSTQITIEEARGPIYDSRTGLVVTPGIAKPVVQAQFKSE